MPRFRVWRPAPAPLARSEPAHERGADGRPPVRARTSRRLWLVGASVVAYALLWLLGQGPLEHVYTAEWTSRRIVWLYAPSTLFLVVLTRRAFPAALSILGLVLGVVVGELIGGRILATETARLDRELAGGGLQSWDPSHPGWWIASTVFVVLTAAGGLVAWLSRRPDPGGTGDPRQVRRTRPSR